ncbi:iron-containing redox enzyme family protein [Massilia sp. Root335]|uniref:iron-containing redox enzyme family protein n=1 Tax=Massilia sp. Root335 TaxID=1736517 RepID=UPI0009E7645A|nr:iron-containing redox enzyme family protein [Massilia sp. Root335]
MTIENTLTEMLGKSFDALEKFNRKLGECQPMSQKAAEVYICSIYSLHRTAPSGIAHLAARLTDELMPIAPFDAHAMTAWVLDAAADEYGLRGGETHTELLARFGEAFGVDRTIMESRCSSTPGAAAMEASMNHWFRQSPLDFALGVHLASELTSRREFEGWLSVLGNRDHPGWVYLHAHCAVEDGHVSSLTTFATKWIELRPNSRDIVFDGVRAYDAAYARMFNEMAAEIGAPPRAQEVLTSSSIDLLAASR